CCACPRSDPGMSPTVQRVTAPIVRRLERVPLTWRLVAILLTILLAAMVTTSTATAYLLQRDLKQNVDEQLQAVKRPIAEDSSVLEDDNALYQRNRNRNNPTNFFIMRQSEGQILHYQAPTGAD